MKPAAVILDLLRTYPQRGTTVRSIMATGAMFEFSENVMRVNLSRLVAKGVVENFKRGRYRLTDYTDPLNDFVEEWRLGEARVKAWDAESWLLVHAGPAAGEKGDWALDAIGFRRISAGLWARPDCLSRSASDLERLLHDLGMDTGSVLLSGARMPERWQPAWPRHFDIAAMATRYLEYTRRLAESQAGLDAMPHESALKESFYLGGAAVHILAKDPLIPAQLMDPAPRHALWQAMLKYDRKGREIWGRRGKDRPEVMPTPHMQVSNG